MNIIKEQLKKAGSRLKKTSLSPHLDAEILLGYTLKKDREYLYAHLEQKLTASQTKKYTELINRREKYEPVAYIIGRKEFFGMPFKVNKYTLIPRPETEILVEETLRKIEKTNSNEILLVDIGTGTGCIPISIAKNLKTKKNPFIYGIDISLKALTMAKINLRLNRVGKKVKFLQGNLLSPLLKTIKKQKKFPSYLFITANLPYLPTKFYLSSLQDVRMYEPRKALDGGKDGLKYYKKLFKQVKQVKNMAIKMKVHIFCEIDYSQKKEFKKIVNLFLPSSELEFKKDLHGLDRIALISLSK